MTDQIRSLIPRYGRLPRELLRDPNMPDRAVRLFGILDDYAGSDGRAFPSRATLAEAMGCSVDSVDRAIKALETAGWVIREVRRRPDRTYESTLYTLTAGPVSNPVDNPSGGSRTGAASSRMGARGVAAPVPTEGEPQEEEPPISPPRGARDIPDDDPDWQRFWTAYPKKVGKGAARKAWVRALRKTTPDQVMAGLEVYRTVVKTFDAARFIQNPATWLNQESWTDERPVGPDGGPTGGTRPRNVRSTDEECPIHAGQHRDRCGGCAADARAIDRPVNRSQVGGRR